MTPGDRVYVYGTGQHLAVSLDLPVTGHVTEASAERARRPAQDPPWGRPRSPHCPRRRVPLRSAIPFPRAWR
ncbi:AraC family transcriptional regulator N-terminal domain-containing protein [Streptomyces spinosirectus]